jgi:hypothetical protein
MTTFEIGSLPDRYDITHLAGEAFRLSVPVLDGDGAPVDAADLLSARVHVRAFPDSQVILSRFSTEEDPANAEITGGTAAVLVLTASSGDTTDWQAVWPGRGGRSVVWWDAEVTDADGQPHQITAPGTITLVHQITR